MSEHLTLNEELLDAMTRHQIGIQRFAGGVKNDIWALLDATEADLRRQILNATGAGLDTRRKLRALDKLLFDLRQTRHLGFVEANKVWRREMTALGPAEAAFLDGIIVTTFSAVELNTVLPDAARLRNIAKSKPFMGKTLKDWSKNLEQVDIARIEDQIKIGLTQGETPQQISRRIVGTRAAGGRNGVTQITRRGAEAITRTVTNGVAAESRAMYAEANSDLAPDELFTATLDSRTTPICRKFDGKVFKVGKGPVLPLHFGERSIYSPIVDGKIIGERPMRSFTEQSLLREFARKNGIKPVPKSRKFLPRGSKGAFDSFARGRMRELTGRVPARTTYNQFLKRQTAAIQDDILGKARGALFRRGGLTLDKFVDIRGNTLTLSDLAKTNRRAFVQAGLDPDDFIRTAA